MTSEGIKKADQVMAATYARLPLEIARGRGCELWDETGRKYVDFVAGIAVCNLGHCQPRVTRALAAQADTLCHVSNLYYTRPQIELADWLVKRSFADKVFFCNSGAEANEAAIKLARKHFSSRGQSQRYRIIAMEGSFHGRTMGALSATGQEKIRSGFEPLLEGFDFVPFNDIDALKHKTGPSTCAVLMETIQGEGGVRCADSQYAKQVRQLCDDTGMLLMFDEVQTGIGRTGKLFSYEHFGIVPDVITLAKALGNGLPIGAMLAADQAAEAFGPGSHATTFGGTPVITAAALETLRILEEEKLVDRCCATGTYFKKKLLWLKEKHVRVKDVRGKGLLLGVQIDGDGAEIVKACMGKGFLINCVQENVLRFVPPLVIETEQIDALVELLDGLL